MQRGGRRGRATRAKPLRRVRDWAQELRPRASWQRLPDAGDRVAFHHTEGGTLAVNATCDKADDVPLDVLTNHLLFGIGDRREQVRAPITVDGRAALRTRLEGRARGRSAHSSRSARCTKT
jgi:hypothetical protein